jgi:hypothetical protein
MTLDEYKQRAKQDLDDAFEAGKAQGGGDITQNPLYYMNISDNQWRHAAFPEGFEFVLHVKTLPSNINSLLMNTTGVKTAKLICDKSGSFSCSGVVRGSTVEVLDITEFKPTPTNLNYFAITNTNLVSVLGELDVTNCTTATNAFNGTNALKDIRFKEGTISIALDFKSCTKLSAESYDSVIKGHSKTASVTLTLPAESIVRNVFDTKFGSGAWDAITAEYPNLTISYM